MFCKLHEKLLLQGSQKLPYAVVKKGVSQKEMEALKLCNGLIDVDLPLVPQALRNLVKLAEKRGWVAACERGDVIRPEQKYHLYPARPTGPSPGIATTAASTATCPRRTRNSAGSAMMRSCPSCSQAFLRA